MITKRQLLEWLEQFNDNTELTIQTVMFAVSNEDACSIDLDTGWTDSIKKE